MKKSNKIFLIVLLSLLTLLLCGVILFVVHGALNDDFVLNNEGLNSNSHSESSNAVSVPPQASSKTESRVEKPKVPTVQTPIVLEEQVSQSEVQIPVVESEIDETQTVEFITQKNFFEALYLEAKLQYTQKVTEKILSKQKELSATRQDLSSYTVLKQTELRKLDRKYAEMGLYDSNAHKNAKISLANQYDGLIKECTAKERSLANEIAKLQKEVSNPDVLSVLALVAYNNNMSADEVAEKYEKYMQQ